MTGYEAAASVNNDDTETLHCVRGRASASACKKYANKLVVAAISELLLFFAIVVVLLAIAVVGVRTVIFGICFFVCFVYCCCYVSKLLLLLHIFFLLFRL